MNDSKEFYLLCINEDQTRLFKGDKDTLQPVAIENALPDGIEAAKQMATPEVNVQMRGGGDAFGDSPIFRNQDMGTNHQVKDWKRYCYHIDQGIQSFLGGSNTPLILVAPDHVAPIYKDTSDYLSITPTHIGGDFTNWELDKLHREALDILDR